MYYVRPLHYDSINVSLLVSQSYFTNCISYNTNYIDIVKKSNQMGTNTIHIVKGSFYTTPCCVKKRFGETPGCEEEDLKKGGHECECLGIMGFILSQPQSEANINIYISRSS